MRSTNQNLQIIAGSKGGLSDAQYLQFIADAVASKSGGGGGGGAPTGPAGGGLSGTYPNPTVASIASISAGGDLSGTYPNPTVSKVNGSTPPKIYNVKDYGALGDGSTDDTTAIQTACDAAYASTLHAGTVYFPNGNYNVTGIVVGAKVNSDPSSFVSLIGESENTTTIRYTGSTSGNCVTLQRNKYSSIKNITIHNVVAKGTTAGLVTTGPPSASGTQSNGNILENVSVDGFHSGWSTSNGSSTSSELTAIHFSAANCDNGFFNNDFNALNITFINLEISNCTIGINAQTSGVYVFGGAASTNGTDFVYTNGGSNTIIGFRSENSGTFVNDGGPYSLSIRDCVVQALTGGGTAITLASNNHLTISDSIIGGSIHLNAGSNGVSVSAKNTLFVSTTSTKPFDFADSSCNGTYNIFGSFTAPTDGGSVTAINDRFGAIVSSVLVDSISFTSVANALYGLSLTNAASGGTVIASATSPTQASSGIVGNPIQLQASNATAGSSVAGAVVGGNTTISGGNAARLTSGNAKGGAVIIVGGTGVGNNGGGLAGQGAINLQGYGGLYSSPSTTMVAVDPQNSNATSGMFSVGINLNATATSGTFPEQSIGATYHPTSTSTLVPIPLLLNPTINFSNGTPGSGHYEALKIAVTETALPTGQNYLIRASAGSGGSTDKFTVTNAGLLNTYNGISTAGTGIPSIVATGRVTVQSAANASIATYTTPASDGSYEVSMNMNVTAATAVSTSMNCTYTDESNTSRTMIFPTTSLSGSFLAGGLVTGTGAFETPVMHIRCKASTAITLFTATGTFTGVTYTGEGIIKQMS